MDPNHTLDTILTIARPIALNGVTDATTRSDIEALAENIMNLSQWLHRGGFLPLYWSKADRFNDPKVAGAMADLREAISALSALRMGCANSWHTDTVRDPVCPACGARS